LQMAGFMPDRNLRSIIAKYWRLTGKGMSAKDCLIRKDETFYDYVARQPMGYDMYWLEARKSRETLLDFLALTPEEVSQKFDEEASAIFATRFPNFVARQPERGIIEDQNEVVISNGSLCTTF
jgi:hypothetical protein